MFGLINRRAYSKHMLELRQIVNRDRDKKLIGYGHQCVGDTSSLSLLAEINIRPPTSTYASSHEPLY